MGKEIHHSRLKTLTNRDFNGCWMTTDSHKFYAIGRTSDGNYIILQDCHHPRHMDEPFKGTYVVSEISLRPVLTPQEHLGGKLVHCRTHPQVRHFRSILGLETSGGIGTPGWYDTFGELQMLANPAREVVSYVEGCRLCGELALFATQHKAPSFSDAPKVEVPPPREEKESHAMKIVVMDGRPLFPPDFASLPDCIRNEVLKKIEELSCE